jgi:hypothetical protein
VQCPDTPDLNVRDALTVAAWVKYVSVERPNWLCQQAAGKGRAWILSVMAETHTPAFECHGLNVPATAPVSRVIGKTSLDDGRWHQIAGVYDSQTLAVYVDGRLEGAETASGLLLLDSESITLGQGNDWVATWRGLMRDVRVYDRALSAEEITRLYEETK